MFQFGCHWFKLAFFSVFWRSSQLFHFISTCFDNQSKHFQNEIHIKQLNRGVENRDMSTYAWTLITLCTEQRGSFSYTVLSIHESVFQHTEMRFKPINVGRLWIVCEGKSREISLTHNSWIKPVPTFILLNQIIHTNEKMTRPWHYRTCSCHIFSSRLSKSDNGKNAIVCRYRRAAAGVGYVTTGILWCTLRIGMCM